MIVFAFDIPLSSSILDHLSKVGVYLLYGIWRPGSFWHRPESDPLVLRTQPELPR